MIAQGRVWKLGDGIEATDLLPARYDELGAKGLWHECAAHLFEDLDPAFASQLRPGDIVLAGKDLGSGHSHYYRAAILACRAASIGAMLAESVVDLFLRGAIDQGLAVWNLPSIAAFAEAGDNIRVDFRTGTAENLTRNRSLQFKPAAPLILDILAAGGAFEWAKGRARQRVA